MMGIGWQGDARKCELKLSIRSAAISSEAHSRHAESFTAYIRGREQW
jgi:hypothetical protein